VGHYWKVVCPIARFPLTSTTTSFYDLYRESATFGDGARVPGTKLTYGGALLEGGVSDRTFPVDFHHDVRLQAPLKTSRFSEIILNLKGLNN